MRSRSYSDTLAVSSLRLTVATMKSHTSSPAGAITDRAPARCRAGGVEDNGRPVSQRIEFLPRDAGGAVEELQRALLRERPFPEPIPDRRLGDAFALQISEAHALGQLRHGPRGAAGSHLLADHVVPQAPGERRQVWLSPPLAWHGASPRSLGGRPAWSTLRSHRGGDEDRAGRRGEGENNAGWGAPERGSWCRPSQGSSGRRGSLLALWYA